MMLPIVPHPKNAPTKWTTGVSSARDVLGVMMTGLRSRSMDAVAVAEIDEINKMTTATTLMCACLPLTA